MKLNFKKVASVLTGTALLGSTIGLAGALAADTVTYPSSFSNSVVVVGSASTADTAPANDIAVDLGKLSATKSVSGESLKIETGSDKLNIGDNLTSVKTTDLSYSDLPTLLAKKTFQSKDGVSYDYEQTIKLAGGSTFTLIADLDYNNKIPALGIIKGQTSAVLNYTVTFTKTVESDVDTAGRLEDIQDSDIVLLGKSYRVLNAYNDSSGKIKLELMAGSVVDTLSESGKKTYTIGGKTYEVTIANIASDGAAFTVNGQTTTKLAASSTYKLKDGTQIGVRTLWYQANKVSSVEFTIGAEKITLHDDQLLKLNDENVNDITVRLGDGMSGTKRTISSITLEWVTSNKAFVAPDKELVMPGLKSIKLTMTDLTVPKTETISLTNSGDKTIQLRAPIKSGTATIPLLSLNSSASGISLIGGDSAGTILRTSDHSKIVFNRTTDQYFVASWNSSTAGESYLLKVPSTTANCPSTGYNCTAIRDAVSDTDVCKDKKVADTCTIGNVVLTVDFIDPNGEIRLTGGAGVSFNNLYTVEGLRVILPVDMDNASVAGTVCGNGSNSGGAQMHRGYINISGPSTLFNLGLAEEDKNSVLSGGKYFNVTIGIASSKIEVNSIDSAANGNLGAMAAGTKYDLGGSSTISKYVAYMTSSLGTKLIYDTKPDQNTLEIEYYGGEVSGNVYVATSSAIASSVLVVKDSEIDQYKTTKDLVVVGGAAINKVAADLLKLTYPTEGTDAAWTAATGVSEDKAIIKLFSGSDSLTPGKVALLVAGYEAKDTQAAAKALIAEKKFGVLSTTTASTYTYQ